MVTEFLKNILIVGAGSFVGGSVRYAISLALKGVVHCFPWATLTVNMAGCFLIGLFYGLLAKTTDGTSEMALFLTVGLCGGFTTFSTFSKEILLMLQGGNLWLGTAYIVASVVVGVLLTALGVYITR
jgi:CrcB protein